LKFSTSALALKSLALEVCVVVPVTEVSASDLLLTESLTSALAGTCSAPSVNPQKSDSYSTNIDPIGTFAFSTLAVVVDVSSVSEASTSLPLASIVASAPVTPISII
jgi:hypothetical protein